MTGKKGGRPKAEAKAPRRGRGWPRIAALAAAAALAACALAWALIGPRPIGLSLVGLSSRESSAYRGLLADDAGPYSLKDAAPGTALSPGALPDALIAKAGADLSDLAGAFGALPASLLEMVPPSLREACLDAKGRAFAMPLQLDNFQVAYSRLGFAKAGARVKDPERLSLAQLTLALSGHQDPRAPALLFAGGDDETLLLVFSALCESRGGASAYRSMIAAIRKSADFEAARAAAIGIGPDGKAFSIGSLVDEMRGWKAKGYLHVEWYRLMPADVLSYMRNGLGFAMLSTLSFRRSIPSEALGDFGWDPYPEAPGVSGRAFIAPLTVLALSAKSTGARTVAARARLLRILSSPDAALALATRTGESTALSAAQAPDIQAADALSWAAGAEEVVNGAYRDAFATPAAARAFADGLRAAVRK